MFRDRPTLPYASVAACPAVKSLVPCGVGSGEGAPLTLIRHGRGRSTGDLSREAREHRSRVDFRLASLARWMKGLLMPGR